jgi:phosphoglycerate dehydrogenase-like enzyme
MRCCDMATAAALPLPPDHPLWAMPNVIITPHSAGYSLSQRFERQLWDIFSTNLEWFHKDEALLKGLMAAELSGA